MFCRRITARSEIAAEGNKNVSVFKVHYVGAVNHQAKPFGLTAQRAVSLGLGQILRKPRPTLTADL